MANLLIDMGIKAKESAKVLAGLLSSEKDRALLIIADQLENSMEEIVEANKKDMENAKNNGMSRAMQDRLLLSNDRIKTMAESVREIASLPDPVGKVLSGNTRPNGLEIIKKTVPLGVIGLIYESRPNVTIDSGVLCLKAGNACILRGGSEAIHSNKILVKLLGEALEKAGLPRQSIQLIENTSREYASALMELTGHVDALIPRGGKGLIKSVLENAKVPVIETGAGMCHIYVDESAKVEMAVNIIENAKSSRPSVCNAVETVIVNTNIAGKFLPALENKLKTIELRADKQGLSYLKSAVKASEEDWNTEHNDYILNIKLVEGISQALEHIDQYSTGHSESIITENYDNAQLFANMVDSAAVYLNASTRFTDGGEFGLGAEIGIATQKLHVRGPMGLEALTSIKYVVRGNGQIR